MTPIEAKKKFRQPWGYGILTSMYILVVLMIGALLAPDFHCFPKTLPLYQGSLILFAELVSVGIVLKSILDEITNRRLKVFCNHCKKYIDTGMAWICGYCDQKNIPRVSMKYSFLQRCERCAQTPHTILCPHCGKPSYLDDQEIAENPARAADVNEAQKASPAETRARELADLEHEKKKVKLTAELLKEEVDLKRIEQVKVSVVEKPLRQRLEESLASYRDRNMGVAEICRRELAWAEKEYSKDPEEMERFKVMMDSWRDEHAQ